MSDVMIPFAPHTEAEYEATLAQLLAEIQSLNELMRLDQAEIEKLRAESMVYKIESQRLKKEGELLNADNQARLAQLRTMLDRLAEAA